MMNNFYPSNHYYITNGVESEKLKRKGSKLKAQIEKYLINQPSIIEKLNSLPKVKLEEVFPLIIEYNKNYNVQ